MDTENMHDGGNRHELIRPEDLAGFEAVAWGDGMGILPGSTLLKFVKGEYFAGIGNEAVQVPLGTQFLVAMATLTRGWAYWRDGRIVEAQIHRIVEGVPMPRREELSEYQKEQTWPPGPDGRPKDPWNPDSRGLFYSTAEPAGQEFTFASPTWGGLHAVRHLCRAYLAWRAEHPDPHEWPIVALDTTRRNSRKYGPIAEPLLPIVGGATLADVLNKRVDDEQKPAPVKTAGAVLAKAKLRTLK
jgi:hypothetical protein